MMRGMLRAATLASGLAAGVAVGQEADHSALALELVNEARAGAGLSPLEPGAAAEAAAAAHARDMLDRDYYSHVDPDGGTVRDRFIAADGSRWSIVAENIANCTGCAAPPGEDRVRAFHNGWMQSPGHRGNILSRGLDRFGFAMEGGDGVVYAVQVFSGSGPSPGEAEAEALPDDLGAAALSAANAARREHGRDPLTASDELDALAGSLADAATFDGRDLSLPSDLFAMLPEGTGGWTGLSVAAEACGGCGAQPVAADAAYFAPRVLPPGGAAGAGDATHFGFAVRANGEGRKIAVGVVGRR